MAEKKKPLSCPGCGAVMNHHGEKLVEPQNAEEALRMDPSLGGMIQEIHACAQCGTVASRPGAWR